MSKYYMIYDELTEEYYVMGKGDFCACFYGVGAYRNAKMCLKAMRSLYEQEV